MDEGHSIIEGVEKIVDREGSTIVWRVAVSKDIDRLVRSLEEDKRTNKDRIWDRIEKLIVKIENETPDDSAHLLLKRSVLSELKRIQEGLRWR